MSLLAVVLAFVLGLGVVAQAALLAARGYQATQMELQIVQLQNGRDRLALQAAELRSLDRVEKEAGRLGLVKPSTGDWQMVPGMRDPNTVRLAARSAVMPLEPGAQPVKAGIMARLLRALIPAVQASEF